MKNNEIPFDFDEILEKDSCPDSEAEGKKEAGARITYPTGSDPDDVWAHYYYQTVTEVREKEVSPLRLRVIDHEEAFEFWHSLSKSKAEGVERTRECFRILLDILISSNPADLFTVPLAPTPEPSSLEMLAAEFPHFFRAGVIDALFENCVLAKAGDGVATFDPILLVGDPGVGKTRFFRRLAHIFGIRSTFEIDCAIASATWILSGLASSWAGSKPGEVFTLLTSYRGGLGNPLLFLDELDKVHIEREESPVQTLYTLLEPESARRFRDEYCPIRIDASRIMWVAAANSLDPVPLPIRSRFRVFSISMPTSREKKGIARSIWSELRTNAWGHFFADSLSSKVLDILTPLSPREMRIRLKSAAPRAFMRTRHKGPGSCEIRPEDFRISQKCDEDRRTSIGFRV